VLLHICNVVVWIQRLLHWYWLLLGIVLLTNVLTGKGVLSSRLGSRLVRLVLSSKCVLISGLLRLLKIILWQLILNILNLLLSLLSLDSLWLKGVLVDFNMGNVGLLTSESELLLLEFLLGNTFLVAAFHLFNAVGVTNGVEGVFTTSVGGRDIGNHGCLGVTDERVLENLCEFRAPERCVLFV
jgi:hypothetical protein